MKSIAITGISGYIGSRLLARLNSEPEIEHIIGIDIKEPKDDSLKLEFHRRDVTQPLADLFIGKGIDAAIHLAFSVKPSRNRKRTREIDIQGTTNFLIACERSGVSHILYPSSHTVYGAHPNRPESFTEDTTHRPLLNFQYSRDKADAERLVRDYGEHHADKCISILRSCPVIGPNAAGSVIDTMFTRVVILVSGYNPPLQLVHEDDLIELMVKILKERVPGVFNVAAEPNIRYGDLAQLRRKKTINLSNGMLKFLLRLSWALHLQNKSPASGMEFIKYPPIVSTEKLRTELGFNFTYSSREALLSFLNANR